MIGVYRHCGIVFSYSRNDYYLSDSYPIHMQTSGKIVVVGQAKENFAVARYNTDGGLDTTFSGDGRVLVNFGFNDVGWVIALHPTNGRIVIGGWSDGTQSDFALARLLP